MVSDYHRADLYLPLGIWTQPPDGNDRWRVVCCGWIVAWLGVDLAMKLTIACLFTTLFIYMIFNGSLKQMLENIDTLGRIQQEARR